MIAVDTNLLVYAHREDSPWHETAYARLADLAEARGPWAIPWPCLHEFLAIVTHPRLHNPPTPLIPSCSLMTTSDMLFSERRRACGNPRNCRKVLLRVWR